MFLFSLLDDAKLKRFEVDDVGISFAMNQKGGMHLVYRGYAFTKKSSSTNRHYWRCIHQKALNCHAGIAHILNKNKYKIMNAEHNHPILTERRKPGEFKALIMAKTRTS